MRRHLSRLQWIELSSGIAAFILGLLGLSFALFGPLVSYGSSSTSCDSNGVCTSGPDIHGTTSLAQSGLSPVAVFFIRLLVFCLLGVAISALLHSAYRKVTWLVPLLVTTVVVLAIMLLGSFSIGLFIAPAALAAVIAVGIGISVQVAEHA